MARATENLFYDHDHIMIGLDAIDRALWHAARGQRSIEFFELALDFIVIYADGAHYDKEELLFAAAAQAMPPAAGPAACLNMEHDATRAQAGRMRAAIDAVRAGDDAEWFTIMDAFVRYTTIIRVHLPKENAGFFPMSDQILPAQAQADLAERFAAIDRALPGTIAGAAAGLQQQAAALQGPVQAAPTPKVEANHTDKYPMYDDRLAAALAQLQVD